VQADAFATSGRTGDSLICRPSSVRVPFVPLPCSGKVRCVTGPGATMPMPFPVLMVRICILRIQSVVLLCVCPCTLSVPCGCIWYWIGHPSSLSGLLRTLSLRSGEHPMGFHHPVSQTLRSMITSGDQAGKAGRARGCWWRLLVVDLWVFIFAVILSSRACLRWNERECGRFGLVADPGLQELNGVGRWS